MENRLGKGKTRNDKERGWNGRPPYQDEGCEGCEKTCAKSEGDWNEDR